jgi:hypothetical protein
MASKKPPNHRMTGWGVCSIVIRRLGGVRSRAKLVDAAPHADHLGPLPPRQLDFDVRQT